MKNVHVLAIPYPAQGHVTPLMEAARCLANNGLKVTFVNTDFTHKRIMSACSSAVDGQSDLMQMVSIPDGMEPCEDRNDHGKLIKSMFQLMPTKLEELINDINKNDEAKITCIIADCYMGWAMKVAQKMGIRLAVFCPSSVAVLAVIMSVQNLMEAGVISNNGVPMNDEMVQLSPSMPLMDPANFIWACIGDSATTQIIFDFAILDAIKAAEAADHIICNSTMELETGAFTLFPKMLPIGPLLATNGSTKQVGHFWNEDSTCLSWLDQQPVRSVIYVAFGSFTVFDQLQFEELALALEDMKKPFLWVVRPGMSGSMDYDYPTGYMDRIDGRGKMVSWAPQQEVLNHPSVACFMSHCGWNSTMEGVSNGVPFLCWPYFADQFFNKTYICDIWKTGVGLNKDDTGVVARGEIKSKLEHLFSNNKLQENALSLQEKVRGEGNSSKKNLKKIIDWVKEGNDHAHVNKTCK